MNTIDDENSIAAKHRHDFDQPTDRDLRRQLTEMEAERDEAREDRDRLEARIGDLEHMAVLAYVHAEVSVGRLAELLECSYQDAQARTWPHVNAARSELERLREAAVEAVNKLACAPVDVTAARAILLAALRPEPEASK